MDGFTVISAIGTTAVATHNYKLVLRGNSRNVPDKRELEYILFGMHIRRNALIELIMLCDAARWQGIEILMTSMAARMSIATLC